LLADSIYTNSAHHCLIEQVESSADVEIVKIAYTVTTIYAYCKENTAIFT